MWVSGRNGKNDEGVALGDVRCDITATEEFFICVEFLIFYSFFKILVDAVMVYLRIDLQG